MRYLISNVNMSHASPIKNTINIDKLKNFSNNDYRTLLILRNSRALLNIYIYIYICVCVCVCVFLCIYLF